MAVIEVGEADGWDGIAAVLGTARAGDTVSIGPGIYRGASELRVPSNVHLRGEDGNHLIFEGEEVAIRTQPADGVTITGVDV